MKNYHWLTIITGLILLSGCGPIYKTEYTYQPPRSQIGKMCASQCTQTKINCQQLCEMRNESCKSNGRQEAMIQYLEYKESQIAAGKPVKRTPENFNTSYCNESCDCTDTYNQCYQTCGGMITPYQVCTAFCK